jgi:cytochrome c biogenesis protein CcdA
MSDLLAVLTAGMDSLVNNLPVGYAFGAGMMSSINPCGFAMLPAYLALYMGSREQDYHSQLWIRRVFQGLVVGMVMAAGFVLLFGGVGLVISAGGRFIMAVVPWVALMVGAGLILLGIWRLTGHRVDIPLIARLANRIGDPRTTGFRGFFLFGLAYGASSLSCTMPIFLVVVGSSVAATSFLAGLAQFVSYGLGMGAVILVLTLGTALLREGVLIRRLHRLMPHLQTATAAFLVLAGAYILYYWLVIGAMWPAA